MRNFGSGWVFLVCKPKSNFKLEILTLPNQESVLLQLEPSPGLLCRDLWEHAHYLQYRNRRADWLKAWWDVVHWDYIGERPAGAITGKKQRTSCYGRPETNCLAMRRGPTRDESGPVPRSPAVPEIQLTRWLEG